jgi:hypothetical protein
MSGGYCEMECCLVFEEMNQMIFQIENLFFLFEIVFAAFDCILQSRFVIAELDSHYWFLEWKKIRR